MAALRARVLVVMTSVGIVGLGLGALPAGAATTADDTAAATDATIGLPDLPADEGWDGHALGGADQATQDDQDAALGKFAECTALRAAYRQLYAAPYAGSTYEGPGKSVADVVVVFTKATAAAKFAAAYRNPKTTACFRQYWSSLYDASYAAKVTVERLPAAVTAAAGGTVGVRLRSDYVLDAKPTTTFFDFLTVRRGRGAGTFTFSSNDTPFPAALQKQLLTKVAGRLPH